jgi:hypothetical protein
VCVPPRDNTHRPAGPASLQDKCLSAIFPYTSTSAPAQKSSRLEPSTLGVAGSDLVMVKPTNSADAIVSVNRFAILGTATFENQDPGTLTRAGHSAAGTTTTKILPSHQGAISKNPIVKDITRVSREIPGLSFASAVQGKFPRDRSNSKKRKNSTENLTNTKSARISTECPHLKVIDENKSMLARTLESISDYKGNDPTLADGIRNLSICMNNINEILGVVMAERLVPGSSPEVQIFEEAPLSSQTNQVNQVSQVSHFSFSSAAINSRKPL